MESINWEVQLQKKKISAVKISSIFCSGLFFVIQNKQFEHFNLEFC